MKPKGKISILPLLLVSFISTLGYSIMLPFLVYLVKDFKGNDFLYGVLGASYSAFQLVGAPLLGKLSDSFGRKKLLIVSEAGSVLSWAIFFVALFLPVTNIFHLDTGVTGNMLFTFPMLILFIARAVDGITAGDVSVANAYLADITEEKDRKKNFGRMGAAGNMGFIFGPLIAAALGGTALGLKLPIIAAAAITILAFALTIFMLPESSKNISKFRFLRKKTKEDEENRHAAPKLKFLAIAKLPGVPLMLLLYFVIFLGFNLFYTAFPLYAIEDLKWSIAYMGVFFAILSGIMVLVEGPGLTYLSKKYSDETLMIAGNLVLAGSFLLMYSGNNGLIFFSSVLFSIGNGIMWPSFLSILSRIAGNTYQGAVQGLASSAGSLASIIGLILGGILFHWLGAVIFIIVAIVIFIVFLLSFGLIGMGNK